MVEDDVEAFEIKCNLDKYRKSRLTEKVTEMQKCMFKGKTVSLKGLSIEDM